MIERPAASLPEPVLALPRTVVLVGMMGSGKSAIGRRLATRLGVPFVDADTEIENHAGCSISDIFERDGEAAFRAAERRVISSLLDWPVHVLATGGGAFMDSELRPIIRQHAITIWIKADLDVLLRRTARNDKRPLLRQGNPKEILADLMRTRSPIYAEADIHITSDDSPHDVTLEKLLAALGDFVAAEYRLRPPIAHG